MRWAVCCGFLGLLVAATAGCTQSEATLIPGPTPAQVPTATGADAQCPACFLKDAVETAKTGETVQIPPGTYTLSDGPLVLDKDIKLVGAGAEKTIIQASDTFGTATHRVIKVIEGTTVTISGITIRYGVEDSKEERMIHFALPIAGIATINAEFGGGVYNHGTLLMTDVVISGNSAGGGAGIFNGGILTLNNSLVMGNVGDGEGGGIFNGSKLTLINSTVSDNRARGGGAISNWGEVNLVDSTIRSNSATYEGGGIRVSSTGELNLTTSTVSGNEAYIGGGIINWGVLVVTNSTISSNRANQGGGIYNRRTLALANSTLNGNQAERGGGLYDRPVDRTGTAEVVSAIIAGNTAAVAPDCAGSLTSLGHNFIGIDSGCGFSPTIEDQMGSPARPIDPMLGPLSANGGPTETQALLPDSPAIRGGSGVNGNCPATDQRRVARLNRAACDVGAYQLSGHQ